jgi:hypothetical protein
MFDRRARVAVILGFLTVAACAAPAPVASPSTGPGPPASPSTRAAPSTSGSAGASASGSSPGNSLPARPSGVPNEDRPLTARELADVIDAVQSTGDSATVVADVNLDPFREACDETTCPYGTIARQGRDPIPVVADQDVRTLFEGGAAGIAGPLALGLGSRVALLGAERMPAGALVLPVGSDALPRLDQPQPGGVYAVRGWLTVSSFPCASEPPLPSDSVFDPCGHSYVMKASSDADAGLPDGAIAVQRSAYDRFAPDAVTDGGPVVPRLGVYLIRQVSDPRPGCSTACRAWVLVGRLDPIS